MNLNVDHVVPNESISDFFEYDLNKHFHTAGRGLASQSLLAGAAASGDLLETVNQHKRCLDCAFYADRSRSAGREALACQVPSCSKGSLISKGPFAFLEDPQFSSLLALRIILASCV